MVKNQRDSKPYVKPRRPKTRGVALALLMTLSSLEAPATTIGTQDEVDLEALIKVGFAYAEHSMEARQGVFEQARAC